MPRTGENQVKSVGIWLRVSMEDQIRAGAPSTTKRARTYAKLKGWHVAEVYGLDTVSGKTRMGHSEAKRMLLDISL